MTALSSKSGMCFVYHHKVAWGDMDANVHVNNVKFFEWFQTARVNVCVEHILTLPGFTGNERYVLAHTNCRYILPVVYPDDAEIHTRILHIGSSSITFEHRVITRKVGLAAIGEAVLVFVDPRTHKKVDITPAQRASLETLVTPRIPEERPSAKL